MKEYLEHLLREQESVIREFDDMYSVGFDPKEVSGGNFDDAFQMGYDHGFEEGQYVAYQHIYQKLCKGDKE